MPRALRGGLAPVAPLLVLLAACGGSLPSRYVIEQDIDAYRYRRYQKTLDVEFVIEGNPAVGHAATYVRRARGQVVAFATAFVTVYDHAAALSAEVRDRVEQLDSYQLSTRELGSGYVLHLDGGEHERWALWVSDRYVVKIAAAAGEPLSEELVEHYQSLYPSDLDEYGRAREGAASAGKSREQAEQDEGQEPLPERVGRGKSSQ